MAFRDPFPGQAKIILVGPPQADIIERIVQIGDHLLDLVEIIVAHQDQRRIAQAAGGVGAVITGVRIIAQIPPVGVRGIVVVSDHDIQAVGGPA